MALNKIFNNPTVKKVIFQIQFPNLFYLESKIPEFQMEIMHEFQDSDLIIKQPITIVNNIDVKYDNENLFTQKIWQFKSRKGYKLEISNNSLSIDSDVHKTYDNPKSDTRFRDAIELCLSKFKKVTNLQYVNRIGLRYIDECPIFEKTTESYLSSFNSAINFDKLKIEDIDELHVKVNKKFDGYNVIYQEVVGKDSDVVILDFDGYATNVKYDECLNITDSLHKTIICEYENTIKQPIIDFMERE